jgi:hypothetical protein
MATTPIADYLRLVEGDADRTAALTSRVDRLEVGVLRPKMRELYVTRYLVAHHPEGARWHQERARPDGATVVQVLEVCHSVTAAWQGAQCLELGAA